MKKNGFTLAEVLITLAIIGVVATLTLPALMSNTQEQQAITGFRKIMNTLNEVAQMNAAVDGFDYSGVTKKTAPSANSVYANGVLDLSIWGMMSTKAQVDVTASKDGGIEGGCKGKSQIFFRDGTVLCYGDPSSATGGVDSSIAAYVDTNGKKAPNQISTCTDKNCTSGKNIRDQFRITLIGSNALPGKVTSASGVRTEATEAEDYAARWAMMK